MVKEDEKGIGTREENKVENGCSEWRRKKRSIDVERERRVYRDCRMKKRRMEPGEEKKTNRNQRRKNRSIEPGEGRGV